MDIHSAQVSQGLLSVVIVIGVYLCILGTILLRKVGAARDFGDVAMIPFDLSNTVTWLICDLIPGTKRRGAKSLGGIYDSVTVMAEKEGVVVTEASPFGECDGPDGNVWYQGVSVRHTPRRKDR